MSGDKKALAEELDKRKDSGHELDGFRLVGRLSPRQPRAVVSVRLGASELQEITGAAQVYGQNVSEFIREAALREARQVDAGIERARAAVSRNMEK